MNNAFVAAMKFESELTVDQVVEARWTNSFCAYRATAKVVRVNKHSVRVKVTDPESYLCGREIPVPLFTISTAKTWSDNNRVAPIAA